MYCQTHDKIGCTTCIALHHTDPSCDKLDIIESIKDLFRSNDIVEAEMSLTVAVQELTKALLERNHCETELRQLKYQASKAMECFIKQIATTLVALNEHKSTYLQKLFVEVESLMDAQVNQPETSLSTAEVVLKETNPAIQESNSEPQQCVFGNNTESIASACYALNEQLVCLAIDPTTFKRSKSCEELLRPSLQHTDHGELRKVKTGESKSNGSYKIAEQKMINIHTSDDQEESFICGSFSYSDGTILLTDRDNHRLKRMLLHLSCVSDYLDLPTGPWSVCAISQTEAAVTLPSVQQVQFICLAKELKQTRTLELDFKCFGIAFFGGELFVSDSCNTIKVYTTIGKMLRQFSKDKSGDAMFSDIRNLTVSENGCELYVADWNEGLIALDLSTGHKIWQYKEDNLTTVCGVCVDECGSIFLCNYNSCTVLQINTSGEKIAEILLREEETHPRSLSFDRNANILIDNSANETQLLALNC